MHTSFTWNPRLGFLLNGCTPRLSPHSSVVNLQLVAEGTQVSCPEVEINTLKVWGGFPTEMRKVDQLPSLPWKL